MKRCFAAASAGLLLAALLACVPEKDAAVLILTPRPTLTATPTQPLTPTPTAVPAPTPTATPTATPVSDEVLNAGVCDEFFSDVVFVGDSLTVGFGRYVQRLRKSDGACLSDAAFVAGEGVSIRSLCHDRRPAHLPALSYDNALVSVTAGIKKSKKAHAFILLGTNDFAGIRQESTLENYRKLLDNIREACPDVEITLTAVPPVTRRFCSGEGMPIDRWIAINPALEQLCDECGYGFFSFNAYISDRDGYLDPSYSSDNWIHINREGFDAWIYALRRYACERMTAASGCILDADVQ